MNKSRAIGIALMAVALTASACSSPKKSVASAPATTMETSTTVASPVGAPPKLKVTPVATLNKPTAMAQRDGSEDIFFAEKTGKVMVFRDGQIDPQPVLDLTDKVSGGTEQGLLGLAFAPGKQTFYVDYTDTTGDTHIVEYGLGTDGTADQHTRRELMTVKQPFDNHNGGQLAFGPDGLLYIGMGDGGGAGDPSKNGQNLSVLLGKILRIDPRPSTDLPYTIPFGNPFVKQVGARGEIWAYGLRNPWRFSFDSKERGIWIADVGQGAWEEIDHTPFDAKGGTNYGWSLREGTHKEDGDKPQDAVDPVYEYGHDNGACSVTGGYVYRGNAIPDLVGRYVFGDFCSGQLSVLTQRGTAWSADPLGLKVDQLASFGQDHLGELYVLSQSGQVGRLDAA